MDRIMKQKDLVVEIAERTGFYKKNVYEIMKALDDIIVDHMRLAEENKPSELNIAIGVTIGGKLVPAHEAKDPRNQEIVQVSDKITPYAKFKTSLRRKINDNCVEE